MRVWMIVAAWPEAASLSPARKAARSVLSASRAPVPAHNSESSAASFLTDAARLRTRMSFSRANRTSPLGARQRARGMDRASFRTAGLDDVGISTHEVLLPWPLEVSVEMTAPRAWRASMREEPIPGDAYTDAPPEEVGVPTMRTPHRRSRRRVVYAGSGNPADYDWLASHGVDVRGRIALVRYSVPYSYRGFKALTAQQRGAAGILIYSDPADDGAGKGKVYPDGPWGPPSHIQRGGIVYDFMVPGDPLTPGWASVAGARRIDRADAESLPRIISAPLSHKDALPILEALVAPSHRSRGKRTAHQVPHCPGPARVKLRVISDDAIRPIWTVTGAVRGPSVLTSSSLSVITATRGFMAAWIRPADRRRSSSSHGRSGNWHVKALDPGARSCSQAGTRKSSRSPLN